MFKAKKIGTPFAVSTSVLNEKQIGEKGWKLFEHEKWRESLRIINNKENEIFSKLVGRLSKGFRYNE